eukprot:SAG11_NODE_5324_length_1595_cov_1.394385_4_plen_107_part_01
MDGQRYALQGRLSRSTEQKLLFDSLLNFALATASHEQVVPPSLIWRLGVQGSGGEIGVEAKTVFTPALLGGEACGGLRRLGASRVLQEIDATRAPQPTPTCAASFMR